jgi:diphthine-ammonia ligase
MEELFVQDGQLVDIAEWNTRVDKLKEGVVDEEDAILKTKWFAAFEKAILERVSASSGEIGLFFSGGVDSTFIGYVLHKNNIPFTCYTVGFQDEGTKDPEDVVMAKRIAEHYSWDLKLKIFSLRELQDIAQETAQIIGDVTNPITVGVGMVVVAAVHMAKEDGCSTLFGGLGSEEIFAGYQRHDKADDINEECWSGMYGMYERDLIRDCRLAAGLDFVAWTPFLAPDVVTIAMSMSSQSKIKDDMKKQILREIAEEAGLEREFAFRPKRAAQYGSRTDSALDKLARRHNFSGKKDYVDSLRK